METANHRCLAATFHSRDNTVSFCELEITVDSGNDGIIVLDGDEETFLDELDCDGSDCAAEIYEPGDDVQAIKSDLEERLRLRFAHYGMCHPNIPLKESK